MLVHLRVAASTMVAVAFGSSLLGRPQAMSTIQKGQLGWTFVMDIVLSPVLEYAGAHQKLYY